MADIDPDAFIAKYGGGSQPAPAAPTPKGSIDPDAFIAKYGGAPEVETPPPPAAKPPPSKLDQIASIFGNAAYFGAGPLVAAGTDYLTDAFTGKNKGKPFGEYRKERADLLDTARENNPWTDVIANTAAGLAGGAGAAATLGRLSQFERVKPLVDPIVRLAESPARAGAASGLGFGVTTGLNEALSHGKSAGEAAQQMAESGALGMLTGGATGGLIGHFTRGAPKSGAVRIPRTNEAEQEQIAEFASRHPDVEDALTRTSETSRKVAAKKVPELEKAVEDAAGALDKADTTVGTRETTIPPSSVAQGRLDTKLPTTKATHILELDLQKVREAAPTDTNKKIADRLEDLIKRFSGKYGKGVLYDDEGEVINTAREGEGRLPIKDLLKFIDDEKVPEVKALLQNIADDHLENVHKAANTSDRVVGPFGGAQASEAVAKLQQAQQDLATARMLQSRLGEHGGGHANTLGIGTAAEQALTGQPVGALKGLAKRAATTVGLPKLRGGIERLSLDTLRNPDRTVMNIPYLPAPLDRVTAGQVRTLLEQGIPLGVAIQVVSSANKEGGNVHRLAQIPADVGRTVMHRVFGNASGEEPPAWSPPQFTPPSGQ